MEAKREASRGGGGVGAESEHHLQVLFDDFLQVTRWTSRRAAAVAAANASSPREVSGAAMLDSMGFETGGRGVYWIFFRFRSWFREKIIGFTRLV